MDITLPAEPIDRMLPALPTERMLPADPKDRMLPVDAKDRMLRDESPLSWELVERTDRNDESDSRLATPRERPRWVRRARPRAVRSIGPKLASEPMSPPSAATAPTLRPSLKRKAPGTRNERELWDQGHEIVVGIDEVGRGAWAGPLTLGAVVIPKERRLTKVRDSKMLTSVEREVMFERITSWAEAWSVGHATHEECDELGMSEAQRLAARRAIDGLGVAPDRVLLDGKWDFVGGDAVPTTSVRRIVKGDASCLSIAAASIVAKVTRDAMMRSEADEHPWWSFETNKGYPCPRHKVALAGVGPSAIHRRSWVFMENLPWPGAQRRVPRHLRSDPNQGVLFT